MYDGELMELHAKLEHLQRSINAARLLPGPEYDLSYGNDGVILHRANGEYGNTGSAAYSGAFTAYLTGEYEDGVPLIGVTTGGFYIGDIFQAVGLTIPKVKAERGQLSVGYSPYANPLAVTRIGAWSSLDHTKYEFRMIADIDIRSNGEAVITQRWFGGDIYALGRWW